jgi:hypothetical protein
MKSVSKVLAGLSLVLVACAITACGGDDEAPAEPGAGGTTGTGGAVGGAGGAVGGAGGAVGGGGAGGAMGGAGGGTGGDTGTGGTGGTTGTGGTGGTTGTGGTGGTTGTGGTGGTTGTGGTGGTTGCVQTGDATMCTESATPASTTTPAVDAGADSGDAATDAGAASNCPAALTTHGSTAVDRACWAMSASLCSVGIQTWAPLGDVPMLAIDNKTDTRFTPGTKQGEASSALVIDLKSPMWIDGLKLDSNHGQVPGSDKIVNFEVDVSLDKTTWTPVACGSNNTQAVLDIGFTSAQVRYIKIIQLLQPTADATAAAATKWWSLHEIFAYLGAQPEGGVDAGDAGDAATDAPDDVSVDAPSSDAEVDAAADVEVDASVDASAD